MSCNNCFQSCDISQCVTTIFVGQTASITKDFYVYLKSMATKRIQMYQGSTDVDGILSFTPDDFIISGSEFLLWAFEVGQEVEVDITPYTNVDTPTFSDSVFDCVYFKTAKYFNENEMYLFADQYLKLPS